MFSPMLALDGAEMHTCVDQGCTKKQPDVNDINPLQVLVSYAS